MKALLAALLLAAGCSTPASAAPLADIRIIDRTTGNALETYRHNGRLYVAGTPGNRYAVSLRNRSSGRLLTVISVDGINVVSGETAAAHQSGYVLAPGQAAEIAGWRKSMEEVAAFYFTRLPDSYAARTERPENAGVIGIAIFNEYAPPPSPTLAPLQRHDAAAEATASRATAKAPATEAEQKLGTGHGERISARTEYTDFRREREQPNEMITIYYDSRKNLIARGIVPGGARATPPNPFPGRFVPDPKG